MELNQVDLNKVRIFSVVAREGGIAAAARVLAVTPSAISQSLTQLETDLGHSLFDRIGRTLRITESGEDLLAAYLSYERELSLVLERIADKEERVTGVIRLGIFLGFFRVEFTRAVVKFLAAYPGVTLKYVYAAPSEFEDLLREGKLDAALSFNPPEKHKNLKAVELWEQELLLLAKSSATPREETLAELERWPLIDYYSNPLLFSRWAKHHFGKPAAPKNVRALGASAHAVLDLVAAGAGMGVVPRDLAEPLLKRRSLKVISGPRSALTGRIWLLEMERAREPQRFSLFRSFLQDSL